MSIIQLNHAYQHTQANQPYQSSANHSHINQNEVINSTVNQQPESDLDDFTLDQEGWDKLISYLEGLDVFRRIRYADEINRLNGFEVVCEVLIREWKMEVSSGFVKIKMLKIKPENLAIEKSKLKISQNHFSEIKMEERDTPLITNVSSEIKYESADMKNQNLKSRYIKQQMKLTSKL